MCVFTCVCVRERERERECVCMFVLSHQHLQVKECLRSGRWLASIWQSLSPRPRARRPHGCQLSHVFTFLPGLVLHTVCWDESSLLTSQILLQGGFTSGSSSSGTPLVSPADAVLLCLCVFTGLIMYDTASLRGNTTDWKQTSWRNKTLGCLWRPAPTRLMSGS